MGIRAVSVREAQRRVRPERGVGVLLLRGRGDRRLDQTAKALMHSLARRTASLRRGLRRAEVGTRDGDRASPAAACARHTRAKPPVHAVHSYSTARLRDSPAPFRATNTHKGHIRSHLPLHNFKQQPIHITLMSHTIN